MTNLIVEQVLDLVGGRAEADVHVDDSVLSLTRFANSFIHQNVSDQAVTVRLRLHLDGRTAGGTTTVTDRDSLAEFVERTIAAAKLCPPDPTWPGLTAPTAATGTGNVDRATAEADPAVRAAAVRAFVDAAGGLSTAGYCRTTASTATYGNTLGHLVSGVTSSAAMDGIARAPGADGVARWSGVSLDGLDGGRLGRVAAAKALAGVDAVELPPGRYEVVLERGAVQDLLLFLASYAFNGKAVAEGRSCLRPGEAQFDPALTLLQDPIGPRSLGMPFDLEGTPRDTRWLIREGVSESPLHDRRTAAAAGTATSGSAVVEGERWGPRPTHLSLATGTAPEAHTDGPVSDDSVGGLVAGVRRGLLVTDFWYTRVLDPRSLVVTGLTRNGVWLIEDGVITRPVQNLRFTQSYPEALAPGSVLGVGAVAESTPVSWSLETVTAPGLRLGSWNFTGGASG
ncbi:metallopeptidase TldD-related protein [Longispora sp. NPDC051575]|uniref:TldD/PmbA family protein n=1 Tax=Longispora sp. NPDC051575 TaxID=3154943 RepID=UPI00342A6525